jgi:hypothetical protein
MVHDALDTVTTERVTVTRFGVTVTRSAATVTIEKFSWRPDFRSVARPHAPRADASST